METKKIFTAVMLIFVLTALAGTFQLQKNNQETSIGEFGADFNTIASYGIGATEEQALDKAFASAIEQVVGIVISSESVVENNVTIKDEILSVSNGYIDGYKVLKKTQQDGLNIIEIQANVKTQKLYDKMKSLNIDISKLDTQEIQNVYSRIKTKSKNKEDVSKLLNNTINNFMSKESLKEMIDIKIKNVSFNEDNVINNQVPISIEYEMSIKYDNYIQKITEIEQIFKNLGIEVVEDVYTIEFLDIGVNSREPFTPKPKDASKKRKTIHESAPETLLGFVRKSNNGKFSKKTAYKLNTWMFPASWSDLFPFFKPEVENGFSELFSLNLTLKDKSNIIILEENYNETYEKNPNFDSNMLADKKIASYIKNKGLNSLNKEKDLNLLLAQDVFFHGYISYYFTWGGSGYGVKDPENDHLRFIAPIINGFNDTFAGIVSTFVPLDKMNDISDISLELKEKTSEKKYKGY